MAIPSEVIDQIRDASQIEEVVSDFVSLKKQGASFKACCPFHQEKTPSFVVTPSKNIFKCFGCGKGGDSITFVMEHESLGYVEALKYLAEKYRIEIPEEDEPDEEFRQAAKDKESLLIVLRFAQKFYTEQLHNTEDGRAIGGSYFKERGFLKKTQDAFDLGYAPDKWQALLETATKKGYSEDYLEKAGLILKKESRAYDRFRGRVIFPIHNVSGRAIGFGARTLKKDEQPKYINSPETEVYQKSHILYGIFQAKNSIRKEQNCYLVEGYTDVLSMHQISIQNVVASSGTSLTEGQIQLLKRFTDKVTLLFDGDKAGLKAALRGIDIILENGLDVEAVVLPEGTDPDSFAKEKGGEYVKNYLESKAENFLSFKYKTLVPDEDNPIQRAGGLRELCQTIAVVPDVFKRSLLTKELAHWMEVSEQDVISEVNKSIHKRNLQKVRQKEREEQRAARERQTKLSDAPQIDLAGLEQASGEHFGAELGKKSDYPELLGNKPEAETTSSFRQYEDEITRLLVRYGHQTISGGEYICDYILEEINEIPSLNPKYAQIRILFENARIRGQVVSHEWLMTSCEESLKSTITAFLTNTNQISEHWKKRMDLTIPDEEQRLSQIIPQTILHLKRVYLRGVLQENLRKIKKSSQVQASEIEKLLLIYQELKEQEVAINKELGIVIHK